MAAAHGNTVLRLFPPHSLHMEKAAPSHSAKLGTIGTDTVEYAAQNVVSTSSVAFCKPPFFADQPRSSSPQLKVDQVLVRQSKLYTCLLSQPELECVLSLTDCLADQSKQCKGACRRRTKSVAAGDTTSLRVAHDQVTKCRDPLLMDH